MHLVYKALEKYAIPNVLPPELMPLGKRKDIIPKAKSPIPISVVATASPSSKPPPIPPLPNTTTAKNLTGLDVVKVFISLTIIEKHYNNNSIIFPCYQKLFVLYIYRQACNNGLFPLKIK